VKIIGVIPARYASSRFPGKPLADIHGKPMVWWVWKSAKQVAELDEVIVATDDDRIANEVRAFGGECVMTSVDCTCGTERVAQVLLNKAYDVALNIQGDEPCIKPEMLSDLISAFTDPTVQMATLKKLIEVNADLDNPNVAKIVTDTTDNAMYFSRSPIPYNRDKVEGIRYFKHIGLYGYRREFLNVYAALPRGAFEDIEQLEQLRTLEHGYKLRVVETRFDVHAVDTPKDLETVRDLLLYPPPHAESLDTELDTGFVDV
jgi:3-deoxy-manno-octulosonate cytidylyltransferase (CMP-KDO synthetase)